MKKVLPVSDQNSTPTPIPVVETTKKHAGVYVIGAVLFLIIAVMFGVTKQKNTQLVTVVATPSPVDHRLTTLAVDAQAATVSSNLLTVPITIDTGENTVSAAELHVSVDPSNVKGLKVLQGSFFSSPTVLENKAGDTPGTYVFTIGSLTPRQGAGVIALISWIKTSEAVGSVAVRLDPTTQVAAIGETGTVLKNVTEGVVQY